MTKTITWTTGNGKLATVTVTLKTERYIGHDDNLGKMTRPCCEIQTSATVEGLGNMDGWYRRIDNHPQGVAATCGKLGIMEINAARIDAAIAEIKTTEYYQAWQAKEDRQDAEHRAYDAEKKRINDAMGNR